jgi:ABC-type dipeptide/oligopeptide/nickel transport system permease component
MNQDFVLVARAKGLSPRRVNWHHVLRNALIPVITVLGLQAGALLGGAIFIESVFARPGIGRFAVNAINNRDLPQIQGVVLFVAVIYVFLNLGVDILYGLIDPRIGQDALG